VGFKTIGKKRPVWNLGMLEKDRDRMVPGPVDPGIFIKAFSFFALSAVVNVELRKSRNKPWWCGTPCR
jgi:hypothetical protein